MSWSLSASGSREQVLEQVRDFTPPPSPDAKPPDANNPQIQDPQFVQAERVKSFLVGELLKADNASYSVSVSAGPAGCVSLTLSKS